MHSPLIEVRDVTKTYHDKNALSGVSLTLNTGEIMSLLGVNGAGKTTLSTIIASLHPASSGDVLYKGTSIYENIIEYRQKIGFCPQKPALSDNLTVYEHLYYAGHYFLLSREEILSRIESLLSQFNLKQYADASPSILSGGYKQRLLLARALIHKPSLIILDEPTVALDPHIRRQLWNVIKNLKNEGVSVLLTTHYIDEAEVLSDRICVLNQGQIRLIDTPSNLMSSYNKSKLEDVFLQLIAEAQNEQEK